ncbi:MAG TPA: hypothetical protein VL793_08905, partial [Patescibacteria group bacterium]|nr:hypothetical protein [Patescibacteria group bacterium]
MNAWYLEPPDGNNAAKIYLQAFAALKPSNGSPPPLRGAGTLPPPGASIPVAEKSLTTAFLRANSEALSLLAQGAKYEESRYPVDLSQGFEAILPHLPTLRRSALILQLSAVMNADAHKGKEAASDVLAILALGRSLELEPCLMSQSIRASTFSVAVASLEQILNRSKVPKESLAELMILFKRLERSETDGEGFNRGLVAERANWAALLSNPLKLVQAFNSPGVDLPPEQRERALNQIQQGDRLKTQQAQLDLVFAKLMESRKLPFPGRLNADEYIQRQIIEAAAKKSAVLEVMLRAFAAHSSREAESLQRLRLGMVATALEQFRAEHGIYPDDPSQLMPQYLTNEILDPFDGGPICYRKDVTGFVLSYVSSKLSNSL